MRTSLFVPALFAVSLIGSAALADKSHGAIERVRARGDVVDKSYRNTAAQRPVAGAPQSVGVPTRYQFSGGTSRVSCSDTSADCPTHRAPVKSPGAELRSAGEEHAASATVGGRALRAPAVLDKVLGSERTSFNEAGEDAGMSKRAANRIWAHAGQGAGVGALTPSAAKQAAGMDKHSADTRVSCNDGDQCMASSKATKKQWAYEAVKAGTWKGPEAKKETGAERSLKEMRSKSAEKNETTVPRRERQKSNHEQHN